MRDTRTVNSSLEICRSKSWLSLWWMYVCVFVCAVGSRQLSYKPAAATDHCIADVAVPRHPATALMHHIKWLLPTFSQGGHATLKALENFFPLFKALETRWKRNWCLKALEFCLRCPWECLNNPKWSVIPTMWKMILTCENNEKYSEHQYHLLTWCHKSCVTCWKLRWNRFGKRSLGCLKVLDFVPKNSGHPDSAFHTFHLLNCI